MGALTAEPELVTLAPTSIAVLRERVPMAEMSAYFTRAFPAVAGVAARQQVAIAGPPLAVYYSMPSDSADVGGGFPTISLVQEMDGVTADTLPGGRAVQAVHSGDYDSLAASYDRVMAWCAERELRPGPMVWEIYLTEPNDDDPSQTMTQIVWPVAE